MSWTAYQHHYFRARMEALENEIRKIQAKYPGRLQGHPLVVLYVAIADRMKEIRANPVRPRFSFNANRKR